MDQRVAKLSHYVDADVAAMLVEAGLDTPRKIKAATDEEIEAIMGIGKAKKNKIRKKLPKIRGVIGGGGSGGG